MEAQLIRILLYIAIVISIYLLYLLLCRRNSYFQLQMTTAPKQEGFVATNYTLSPINESFADMPYREYVVKSAFNAAYGTDGRISVANVKKILTDECARFLDFEVFEKHDKAVIGYSETYDNTIDSANTEPFLKIMNGVAENAFASTNGKDPLFLHFRVKTESQAVLQEMAETLTTLFRTKAYADDLKKNTPLRKLMGKVVLIMDVSPQYASNYNSVVCAKNAKVCINEVIHVNSNSGDLLSTVDTLLVQGKTNPPRVTKDRRTTVQHWHMTKPDLSASFTGSNTTGFFKLMHDYGVQISLHHFYKLDDGLKKYKEFFAKHNSAFVPMSAAIAYVSRNGGSESD